MTLHRLALGCALSLSLFSSIDTARSQSRDFGAQTITLDDNAGHYLKITAPTSGWPAPGTFVWTLPFPPQGVATGFVGQGSADMKYLTWDLVNGYWKGTPSLPGALGNGTPNALTKWSAIGDMLVNSTVSEDAGIVSITNSSLLATGTGATPTSGAGTRMMWIPDLSAFRAGEVNGEQWDAANIGSRSIAFGNNVTASGINSTAMGDGSVANAAFSVAIGTGANASGVGSLALGEGTIASGGNSTAMGVNTVASGTRSTAMGLGSEASGSNSVAMGAGATATSSGAVGMGSGDATAFLSTATGQSTASGQYSFSGGSATASGNYSTAIGEGSTASGQASTAFGRITNATGFASVALGEGASATGDYASAIGIGAEAFAEGAVALGDNTASGLYSVALGLNNTASGSKASALGVSSQALGTNSLALGTNAMAVGTSSVAIGSGTSSEGFLSIAAGSSVTASGDYTLALGRYASTAGFEGSFVYGDNSTITNLESTAENQFSVRATGGTRFFSDDLMSVGVELAAGGNSWLSISDSNRKENRLNISGEGVLNKLSNIWMGSWNYKSQDVSTRHYGPMAQEFFAAFGKDGLGIIGNDTTLATADVDGVTLIAVKALIERNDALESRVEMLESVIRKLAMERENVIHLTRMK